MGFSTAKGVYSRSMCKYISNLKSENLFTKSMDFPATTSGFKKLLIKFQPSSMRFIVPFILFQCEFLLCHRADLGMLLISRTFSASLNGLLLDSSSSERATTSPFL